MDFRHPADRDLQLVQQLVQTVVDEIYGGLWTPPPVPIGATDWSPAWIAVDQQELSGVALTSKDWIEDLWVAANGRGSGVGSTLLRLCEAEIKERGFDHARLRVVQSNTSAISFYKGKGWTATREYLHESLPVLMLDMKKLL